MIRNATRPIASLCALVKLFRGNFGEGRHTLTLEAKDLPEGVLYYTLRAGNFRATRKMILQE